MERGWGSYDPAATHTSAPTATAAAQPATQPSSLGEFSSALGLACERMVQLLLLNSDEIITSKIPGAFKKQFGKQLDYKALGFKKLALFLSCVEEKVPQLVPGGKIQYTDSQYTTKVSVRLTRLPEERRMRRQAAGELEPEAETASPERILTVRGPIATRVRASAGHQQPVSENWCLKTGRCLKTGPTKPSKYACPDCAVRFGVYSRCLAHLIATGHANPDNRKGLQQRCAAAAQAVRPQLKPQLSTSQGVGAISTQTADGAKAVHIMRGLASDFRGRVWPKSKHELRVAAKNTSEKDTGVLQNDDVATMCSLWKAAGYRLIPASIPGTERCLGLCSHF